jgi:hypothetical protein
MLKLSSIANPRAAHNPCHKSYEFYSDLQLIGFPLESDNICKARFPCQRNEGVAIVEESAHCNANADGGQANIQLTEE